MIRFDLVGAVARIVIDRPERKNALTVEMRRDLTEAFERASNDDAVRAVVLTGAGDAFCAGADVGAMAQLDVKASRARLQAGAHAMMRQLHKVEKPVIAAVRGPAVGIGWSLALACDLVIAADDARFSAIYARRGLAPDGGAAWLLSRMVGMQRAKELVFTTRFVGAEEAARLQLVSRVVPADSLDTESMTFAAQLAEQPTFALAMAKKLFDFAIGPSFEDFLDYELMVQPQLNQSADYREGFTSFQEKRPPRFTGR